MFNTLKSSDGRLINCVTNDLIGLGDTHVARMLRSPQFANLHLGHPDVCRIAWSAGSFGTQLCLQGENSTGVLCFVSHDLQFLSFLSSGWVVSEVPNNRAKFQPQRKMSKFGTHDRLNSVSR